MATPDVPHDSKRRPFVTRIKEISRRNSDGPGAKSATLPPPGGVKVKETTEKFVEKTVFKGVEVLPGGDHGPGLDPTAISALSLIGHKVDGNDGKQIGKIEEVVMDLAAGGINYLVMSTGGILGIGAKFFALPLDALKLNPEKKVFYLDTTKKIIHKYPGFNKFQWPRKPDWPLGKLPS